MNKPTIFFLMAIIPTFTLAFSTLKEMFPPDAVALNDNYRDRYGPQLAELKEAPLWLDDKAVTGKETFRFTFIPGVMRVKGRHATVIRIDINGTRSRLLARTEMNSRRRNSIILKVADRNLTAVEVANLRDLAEKADPWRFRVGSWEANDAGSISIHCTELIMERRQQTGYAVSHILISCNQPKHLMPLVDYVTELAGQKRGDLRY